MINRRILKHMAFAVIGAAILTEVLAVSAIAASSGSSASLWTAGPLHHANFAVIAAYSSFIDYAGALFGALNLTSAGDAVSARLAELFTFRFQLDSSQVEITLLGR